MNTPAPPVLGRACRTLVWLAALGLASPAVAQDPNATAALPELLDAPIPWGLTADQQGVEALFDHAAGLGFLDGVELGLGWGGASSDDLALDRVLTGAGLRLGPLGLGIGCVSTAGDADDELRRCDGAAALRLGRQLAFGARLERYDGIDDKGHALHDFERVAISTTWRPARTLSLALGIDNVDRPRLTQEALLEPMFKGSLAVRPGSERVALAAEGGAALRGPERWHFGGALRYMALTGLEVGAYGRFVDGEDSPERIEWGAFVAVRQGNLGVEASHTRFEPSGDPDASTARESSLMRFSSRMGPWLLQPKGRVVRLRVDGAIAEKPSRSFFSPRKPAWVEQLVTLNSIAGDDAVRGVHLDLVGAPGWGQAWELRRTLARLKADKKHISIRLFWADMRSVYIASVADRVYGQPSGGVEVGGLSVTRTYLADLLRKMGVEAQFVAMGAYKSAPDGLTRTGPTDAEVEQTRALLADFQAEWTRAVSSGRALEPTDVAALFERPFKSMKAAHEAGLVDRLVSDTELEAALSEELGTKIRFVERYERAPTTWAPWGGRATIAVVPITGTIGAGNDDGGPFGGGSTMDGPTIKLMEALEKDPSVRAVVLRIDSPGGGVLASDRIYEAARKLGAKKPVLVSFGGVAASGGYYVACASSQIYTTPLTVTGSIGIFGGKVHASELFERVGIAPHTEKTHPHGDQRGLHRPWSDAETASLREALDDHYERFLAVVSKARGLSDEETLSRAGGRIYSGSLARKQGLVDAEGSLWDVVEAARQKIQEPGPVRVVVPRASRGGAGWSRMGQEIAAEALPASLGALGRWLDSIASMRNEPFQARMPFIVEIQ